MTGYKLDGPYVIDESNTSIVVLNKIDGLRDILISLDAKIGTGGK